MRTVGMTCLVVLLFGAAGAWGDVTLSGAEFRPDHYQYQRGSPLHQRTMPVYQRILPRGGHFLINLHNDSDRDVGVADVVLNGASLVKGLKSLPNPLHPTHYPMYSMHLSDESLEPWPEKPVLMKLGEPIWYTFMPKVLEPGGFGQITIRMRRILTEPADVSVVLADGRKLDTRIEPHEPNAWFTFIGFNGQLDTAYIYIEKRPDADVTVEKVLFDGQEVTQQSRMPARNFYRNVCPIIVLLEEPLEYGSRHLIEVITSDGQRIVDLVRAWDDFFPIFIYGHGEHGRTDRERAITLTMELREHHFNMNLGGGGGVLGASPKSADIMKAANLRLIGTAHSPLFPERLDVHWALDLQDEPDAHDPQIVPKDYPIPGDLRIGFSAMYNIGLMENLQARGPDKPIWLQINHTGAPQNYVVYGRLPDIHCHDMYVKSSEERPKGIRWAYGQGIWGYLGGLPKPYHMTLLSTWRRDRGDTRHPWPQETRLQAYYTLATGIKGFSYWLYHGPGAASSPPLLAEMGRINLEIATAAPLLARSQPYEAPFNSNRPIEPITVSAETSMFGQALCVADEAMIVLLTNETHRPGKDALDYTPVEDVTVTLELPPWLKAETCFAITHEGVEALPFQQRGEAAQISVGELDLTAMIVVGSKEVLEQTRRRYDAVVAQSARDVAYTQREHAMLLDKYAEMRQSWRDAGILYQSSLEPSIDTDWLAGWVIRDGARLDGTVGRTGRASVRCEGEWKGAYSGGFDSAPGTRYRLRAWVKAAPEAETAEALLMVRFISTEGKEIARDTAKYGTSDQWKFVETNFTAPDNTAKVQFFYGVVSSNGPIWYDDATVKIVK